LARGARLARIPAFVAMTIFLASLAMAESEEAAAVRVIDDLHATYMAVIRGSATLDYQARYDKLAPAIGQAFDLPFMSRAVLGRRWKALTEEQKKHWLDTFTQFTVANYAARMNRDNGQVFEVIGNRPADNNTLMVLTRVVDPKAEDVTLNYRMRTTEAGWKAIDIYAKGTVSELALRRGEYAPLLKSEGIDALLGSVERKVAELASGKDVE
jgi:phospholipid transport system substrate-binding protein